jgi:carboxyl-terminal processing protease
MDLRVRFPWWLILLNGGLAFAITIVTIEFWHRRAEDLPAEELRMLRLVYRQVMQDHVEPHDGDDLLRSAIGGLVKGLGDEYSAFVPPDRVRSFDTETTGEYQGIGISLVPRRAPITVHYPFEGGPAERAGLRVGDRIVGIDGERVAALAPERVVEEARKRLLGAPGSTVRLRLERAGGGEDEVELARGGVQQPSVKWARLLDRQTRIGYVHIAAFQQRTAAELDAALALLEQEAGGSLGGLVLDLRFNPGGLLGESVTVANRFLRAGNIVTLRARGDIEHGRHDVDPAKTTHADLPLVVLVNKDSASASEVLCGALQDHGRAGIVGVRTFGKGVVQSIYRWEGLDFRLKLTTSYYYTPGGRNIERSARRRHDPDAPGGIVPDVEAELAAAAVADLRQRLGDAEVPRRYKAEAAALAATLDFAGEAEQLGPEADAQLGTALAVLRERMAQAAGAAGGGGRR